MSAAWDPDLYNRALRFAGDAHRDQKVPGTDISYLMHLCQVCQEAQGAVLADPSLDGDLVVPCALLHDSVEDTPVTAEEVTAAFGEAVGAGVLALSKRKTIDGRELSKQESMTDSLERIRAQPREVWVVKLADRITNLQPPPPHWNQEKIRAYHAEAERILAALGAASDHLSARMRRKLEQYAAHGA